MYQSREQIGVVDERDRDRRWFFLLLSNSNLATSWARDRYSWVGRWYDECNYNALYTYAVYEMVIVRPIPSTPMSIRSRVNKSMVHAGWSLGTSPKMG
jgi:hypothetical protein